METTHDNTSLKLKKEFLEADKVKVVGMLYALETRETEIMKNEK